MANFVSPKQDKYKTDLSDVKTPPRWKRPDEVMRLHRLRMKHKALQARLSKTQLYGVHSISQLNSSVAYEDGQGLGKRKNIFRFV